MYSFAELLKLIRKEAHLTQEMLAKILGVSTILISMIETGQKKVSKVFIKKLAAKLDVHPSTLAPFVFTENMESSKNLSTLEKQLLEIGTKLQSHLIKVKSKNLKSNAKK